MAAKADELALDLERETPEVPDDPPAAADPDDEPAVAEQPEPPARRGPQRVLRAVTRLPVVLTAAAVVLTGAGAWFVIDTNQIRSSASAQNQALVDPATTAEVSAAVTNALNRIFSYSYERTEVTEQAATAVLRGAARTAYDQLFAQVRAQAPAQKLVLTTRVVSIAVQELRGEHARLLVFLDQSATRADNGTTNASAAQLSVTAKREHDTWVITELVAR